MLLMAGVALVVLGVLAYIVIRWTAFETVQKKKKLPKAVVQSIPATDSTATERLEKRIHAMQGKLDAAQAVLSDREKELKAKDHQIAGLTRQIEQEQAWRNKEDGDGDKARAREKLLKEELRLCQERLSDEAGQRIKWEYERKELRVRQDMLTADERRSTALNAELERKIKAARDEVRELKTQNVKLSEKKEAEQWVAKADYVRIEQELKRVKAALAKVPQGISE